jgi:alkylation response protein AidB-like acyl-CoA dehydrogenase
MHLALSADQEALRDAVAQLYGKKSTPEQVRSAEATGFDPDLWDSLVQMGLPTMGVDVAQGGGGGTMADLAVVAETHGAHLASAPLLETMVVARLLTQPGLAAPNPLVEGGCGALALHPAVGDTARMVPGGSVADVVVALHGDDLVALVQNGRPRTIRTLHAGPVADVPIEEPLVLASGPDAQRLYATASGEWRVLYAATFAGLAQAALNLGVAYVKDREQFGVALGSFQTIQHRLADIATHTDGSHLLAHEAAWAADAGQANAAVLAAQAFWFCGETAVTAAETSLHYHGGYGFMEEYDIQLFARRAKGWRLLAGDPHVELRTIAQQRWLDRPSRADAKPDTDSYEPAGMDFSLDPESHRLQAEVRALLRDHLTPEVTERALSTGTMHDWSLHKTLCEQGYLAAGWPPEVGGLGQGAVATTTLLQELYRSGAPVDGMGIAAMVGATLLLRGNDEQREQVLPRILAGDVLCCLGYSEPDAGSDVAAVQTRAVLDGDEWVINGQKMFTTMAHEAEYVFLLTRTSPDKPKHKGLTMFLVPMATPGIEVTPVETLGGERTNITFYTDVRVPDSCRVGDLDAGWSVMHAALVYERNSANWGEPAHLVDSVATWATERDEHGARVLDDPFAQQRLARWDTLLEVGRLLLYRSAWMAATGALPQVEGSMAKLLLTETFVDAAGDLLELCGPAGLLPRQEPGTVLGGLIEHASRHALVTTIYGGSSEVQREIIAQRGLGLPRSR